MQRATVDVTTVQTIDGRQCVVARRHRDESEWRAHRADALHDAERREQLAQHARLAARVAHVHDTAVVVTTADVNGGGASGGGCAGVGCSALAGDEQTSKGLNEFKLYCRCFFYYLCCLLVFQSIPSRRQEKATF